jgi:hypothetical protein
VIIRNRKKDNPFVQINNTVLEDKRISWKAKGILAYLLSKPDDWYIRMEDIINHAPEGRDAVRVAMQELKKFGYAVIENTSMGKQWFVLEEPEPCPEKPSMAMPCPEKPRMGFANMAKSPPSNTKVGVNGSSNTHRSKTVVFNPDDELFPQDQIPLNVKKKAHGSVEECKAYAKERGLPESDGETFFDSMETSGWKRGGGVKVLDWRAPQSATQWPQTRIPRPGPLPRMIYENRIRIQGYH